MQLFEKGVSIDEHLVDMPHGEHKKPEYKRLNPYGRVPVLVDDDFVLYESSAIMEYLEVVFPTPALLPSDARGRALVSMHVKLCDVEFGAQTRTVIFPRRFLPRERWDMAVQEQAINVIAKHLGVLHSQLAGHEYLVGNAFSLAEIAYAPFLELLSLLELEPPPNVAAWKARIEARPSFAATKPKPA
jgi:glutathione S-transferase